VTGRTRSLLIIIRRLLLALLIALLLAACGGGEAQTCCQPPPSLAVRVVVDDISGSAFKRHAAWAASAVKLALAEGAEHNGLVVVLALTRDTAGQTVIPVRVDFSQPPPWVPDDELFNTNWKQQEQDKALKAYQAWRAKVAPSKGSDYVGAFLVVNQQLAGLPPGDRQVWYVGDGFQNGRGWNMNRQRPNARVCKARAEELRGKKHLGQLHGASVTFIGGGLNAKATLTPTQQADLTACWSELVRVAGGRTPDGWWNPGRFMVRVRP
jgi:hypothetical protein